MHTTNFFKLLGRVKKGEIVRLNVGTFEKVGNNEYLLKLRKEIWRDKSLILKFMTIGNRWHWIGKGCCNKLDIKCRRHEILKVLFEILGIEIEELK